MAEHQDTTELLQELSHGNPEAAEQLLPRVYEELHGLAEGYFRRQAPGHTLQPTALVHEAFIRMIGGKVIDYRGRSHFMAVAATAMQQILIDHARRRRAIKHGGKLRRVTLHEGDVPEDQCEVDLIALEQALDKLAALDERKARVVAFRFFGGLTIEQAAEVLGVARSTVAEDWRFARAWLLRELSEHSGGGLSQ